MQAFEFTKIKESYKTKYLDKFHKYEKSKPN